MEEANWFRRIVWLDGHLREDVTSSKQKPQEENERIDEMWQMTAKTRSRAVEQLTAQRERRTAGV